MVKMEGPKVVKLITVDFTNGKTTSGSFWLVSTLSVDFETADAFAPRKLENSLFLPAIYRY